MAEELSKIGLYLDDLNKIRILEPAVFRHANDLKVNCKTFDDNIKGLQSLIDGFIKILMELGDMVDREKMAAIGLRNSLKSLTKDREQRQQKLQALLAEKTMELERLQLEYHSLQLVEVEQQELLEYLSDMR